MITGFQLFNRRLQVVLLTWLTILGFWNLVTGFYRFYLIMKPMRIPDWYPREEGFETYFTFVAVIVITELVVILGVIGTLRNNYCLLMTFSVILTLCIGLDFYDSDISIVNVVQIIVEGVAALLGYIYAARLRNHCTSQQTVSNENIPLN